MVTVVASEVFVCKGKDNEPGLKYTESYNKYKNWYDMGQIPDDEKFCMLLEEGISSYCTMVYKKGQSLEDYLKERDFRIGMKYPLYIYSFLDENGNWQDCKYYSFCEKTNKSEIKKNENWDMMIEEYISSLDEERVLVGIDYHN